jgi:2-polyprenyl-3-methyl-5-hydroxy-6-metoxy-1,4-benzoquinol methylase
MSWDDAQKHESIFWNDALGANTFTEENKQLKIYSPRLKLTIDAWSSLDFENKSVVDVGAGPVSLLLKGKNLKKGYAIDPLMDSFPQWVRDRYKFAGIDCSAARGEEFKQSADMAIIYNVLQHVVDPQKLIENTKAQVTEIRVFEWISVPADEKHLHVLTASKLNEWFGTKGIVEHITEENSFTQCWYATIKT